MTAVQERMGIEGIVTVEIFQAPQDAPGRPLELIHLVDNPETPSGLLRASQEELESYLAVREVVANKITQVGDQCYGDAFAALCANATVAAPAGVTGMRLGTGNTAPSKTGAGAAIVAYQAGSQKAIDAGFPQSSLVVASRRETWKSSWGAGVVNGVALAEVVITNETPLTNVAGTAANTVSRALIGPYTLDALATLSVTWTHDLLGA